MQHKEIYSRVNKAFTNIEWRAVQSCRTHLIHECFTTDLGEVWANIQADLPAQKKQMEVMLANLSLQ